MGRVWRRLVRSDKQVVREGWHVKRTRLPLRVLPHTEMMLRIMGYFLMSVLLWKTDAILPFCSGEQPVLLG